MKVMDLHSVETLNHAYLIGGNESTAALVIGRLADIGVVTKGNPDFSYSHVGQIGIDESRAIIEQSQTRPIVDKKKIFVISTAFVTRVAQNALLKTFEEPTPHAVFFLVVPTPHALLPTLISRMQVLETAAGEDLVDLAQADQFLAASFADRASLIEPLVKERNVGRIIAFLSALERRLARARREIAFADGLRAIWRAKTFIVDSSAPLKMLLEHVALLVPRVRA